MFINKVLNPQPEDRWAPQMYILSGTLGLRQWRGLHYGARKYEELRLERLRIDPKKFINHYAPLLSYRDAHIFKGILRVMIANAMGLETELNELLIELGI